MSDVTRITVTPQAPVRVGVTSTDPLKVSVTPGLTITQAVNFSFVDDRGINQFNLSAGIAPDTSSASLIFQAQNLVDNGWPACTVTIDNTGFGVFQGFNSVQVDNNQININGTLLINGYAYARGVPLVSATDNAIARFDSTGGNIQNSGVLIDDSNNVTVPGLLDLRKASTANLIQFATNGFLRTDTSQLTLYNAGTAANAISFNRNGSTLNLASTYMLGWGSTTEAGGGVVDTTISRQSTGVIQVGSGAAAGAGGTVACVGLLGNGSLTFQTGTGYNLKWDNAGLYSLGFAQPLGTVANPWGNITSSGTIVASTATSGHRLGYFGVTDAVTFGAPGTSYGIFQAGNNGGFTWSGGALGLWYQSASVVQISNSTTVANALGSLACGSINVSQGTGVPTLIVGNVGNSGADACARIGSTTAGLWVQGAYYGVRATAGSATTVPFTARGFASGTANLLECQNSAATNMFAVTSGTASGVSLQMFSNGGTFSITTSGNAATLGGNHDVSLSNGVVYVGRDSGGNSIRLRVRGEAPQVANLTEWQTSAGVMLASVSSSGNIYTFGNITGATIAATANASVAGGLSVIGVTTLSSTGTVGAPSVTLGDAATGMFRVAANQVGWSVNGTELVRFATGSIFYCFGDNVLYGKLQFGTQNNTTPMLTKTGTTLKARLSDDSAYAPFTCGAMTAIDANIIVSNAVSTTTAALITLSSWGGNGSWDIRSNYNAGTQDLTVISNNNSYVPLFAQASTSTTYLSNSTVSITNTGLITTTSSVVVATNLHFGAVSSTRPMFNRLGSTTIRCRLGDNSADANFSCASLTVSNSFLNQASNAQSSGMWGLAYFNHTLTQTGTAGSTNVLINRNETSLGSGAHYFIDCQVAAVSVFSVTNTGILLTASDIIWSPSASISPVINGQLTVEKTSNTTLTFKLKGSDAVVRSGTITLT